MTQRLRIIAPPVLGILALGAPYILLRLPAWILLIFWGEVPTGKQPTDVLLEFAAVAYGIYRVVAFHPFYRHDYCEWLERTPWTSQKPLPVGPVHWVWEDGLILGGLIALCWADSQLDPVLIVALSLMGHGIALTASLFPTGAWAFGYVTAFALGLAVRLGPNHWAFLAAAAAASLLGHLGLRRSLARFPWSIEWLDPWHQLLKTGATQPTSGCGWPYDQLRPGLPDFPRIDIIDAALVSLLAGWWVFAISALIVPQERVWFLCFVLFLETPFLALMRFILYRTCCAPPISLWGRIATFRWIIPGHDNVYIGPLCTLLAPWPLLYALPRWGVPLEVALPAGCALTLFAALSCGPSLRRWRLTGRHRIVPSLQPKTEFIKVG